jgi:hypothetical protein
MRGVVVTMVCKTVANWIGFCGFHKNWSATVGAVRYLNLKKMKTEP